MLTIIISIIGNCFLVYMGYMFAMWKHKPKVMEEMLYKTTKMLNDCNQVQIDDYKKYIGNLYLYANKMKENTGDDGFIQYMNQEMRNMLKRMDDNKIGDENTIRKFVEEKLEKHTIKVKESEKNYDINNVLDRINQVGVDGLTPEEQEFLKKQSN